MRQFLPLSLFSRNVNLLSSTRKSHRLLVSGGWHTATSFSTISAEETAILREYQGHFVGGRRIALTSTMQFTDSERDDAIPVFRVMGLDGQIRNEDCDPKLPRDKVVEIYKKMVLLNTLDKIMFDSQRQGRVDFYIGNQGEEAAQMGSAAGLEDKDLVFSQYREAGVLLYRGFSIKAVMDRALATCDDIGKGRPPQIHYGSTALNFVTISAPLATQMPQAVGAAYVFKRQRNGRTVACYFGDGASSEGDAHAAMNFASTLRVPLLFFCRNNGYAISTPTRDQYASDGIAGRGPAYGLPSIRVDGNDLFAVYAATRAARRLTLELGRPALIEAITYRLGHHSTSDDSTVYRNQDEVKLWDTINNPITRLRRHLSLKSYWSDEEEKSWRAEAWKLILGEMEKAEKRKKPSLSLMFSDVYSEAPRNLIDQEKELRRHVEEYKERYPMLRFDS